MRRNCATKFYRTFHWALETACLITKRLACSKLASSSSAVCGTNPMILRRQLSVCKSMNEFSIHLNVPTNAGGKIGCFQNKPNSSIRHHTSETSILFPFCICKCCCKSQKVAAVLCWNSIYRSVLSCIVTTPFQFYSDLGILSIKFRVLGSTSWRFSTYFSPCQTLDNGTLRAADARTCLHIKNGPNVYIHIIKCS